MSRVGRFPIKIPPSVEVVVSECGCLTIKSRVSDLCPVKKAVPVGLRCVVDHGLLTVSPSQDLKSLESSKTVSFIRSQWGLFSKLVANCIHGFSSGFVVFIDITGVGNKVFLSQDSRSLILSLGYSHELSVPIPNGVVAKCDKNVTIELRGHDNVVLGDFAARLSALRVPDPYKLKGIVRRGKKIRKKEGKAG